MTYNPATDISDELRQKATQIKLLICDVDGVLSDGKVYYTNSGEEIKNFNIKDGFGIKLAQANDLEIAVITGRQSEIVARRCKELGINHCYQGKVDKRAAFSDILNSLQLQPQQVAHIGDDLPDIALMQMASFGIAVKDAHPLVKQQAEWHTKAKGGEGAVREVIDGLLASKGIFDAAVEPYSGKAT